MKVAINGLGRIGRNVLKIALEKGVNIVAVNDLTDIKSIVYLLKYDSVYGVYDKKVESGKDFVKINGKKILVFSENDPEKLAWKKLGVDVVIEATGIFTNKHDLNKHLLAGCKKVIISAPAKDPDITIVLGVNHQKINKSHNIISMASCTTNCLAPIVKILHDNFIIEMMNIRKYTESKLENNGYIINFKKYDRVCNTISAQIPNINSKDLTEKLSKLGIYVSYGSACNSHDKSPSYVLTTMGLTEQEANSTIRISINRFTTKKEIDIFIQEIK